MRLMKELLLIICAAAGLILSGCATSSESSEVMVDTSAKTRKHVTNAEPGDFEKMADPFLSN
jgi:outer membrane lipoprotein SlyB